MSARSFFAWFTLGVLFWVIWYFVFDEERRASIINLTLIGILAIATIALIVTAVVGLVSDCWIWDVGCVFKAATPQ